MGRGKHSFLNDGDEHVGVDLPRKTFVFRRGAPTCSGFSRCAGVIVGVDLPTKPLSFVGARQHG